MTSDDGVSHFPEPPAGRVGWPWTVEQPVRNAGREQDTSYPKISIVTPSFNQGAYIEETIRSVLLQGYPNLEYLVFDGGSSDNTVQVLKRYSPWLSYWVTERDHGQADAINRGFLRSSGELIAWLNSDDLYLPNALSRIAEAYRLNRNAIVLGDVLIFSNDGRFEQLYEQSGMNIENVLSSWSGRMVWAQPGLFVPRTLYDRVGGLDHSFRYVFDLEWVCRLLGAGAVSYLKKPVAKFRIHSASKTVAEAADWLPEHKLFVKRYQHLLPGNDLRAAEAKIEVWFGATSYVSSTRGHVNRRMAIHHLINALRLHWRVVLWHRFWLVVAAVILPSRIVAFLRKHINVK